MPNLNMKKLFGYISITLFTLFTLLLSAGYSIDNSFQLSGHDSYHTSVSSKVSLSSDSSQNLCDIFRHESISSPVSHATHFTRRIPVNMLTLMSGLVKNTISPFVNDYNTDRHNLCVLFLNKPQTEYYIYTLHRIRI